MRNLKIYLTFLTLFIVSLISFGQNSDKYKDVDALIETGKKFDAMKALNKLRDDHQKDTTNAEYWLRYSKASYTMFSDRDAKFAINKAIEINPNNPVYHFEKGFLLNGIGEPENAIFSLNRAIELSPEGKYYYWKGIVDQQIGNYEEAKNAYEMALKKEYESPELHINYAILLTERESYEEGLIHTNRAIELNDKYSEAYSLRSKLHFFLADVNSACKDMVTARNLGNRNTLPIPDTLCNASQEVQWELAADVCVSNEAYKAGIYIYSLLIDNNYLESNYFLNRGYCYFKTLDYENAEKDYLKALEYSDASKDLLYDNLSLLYFDQNEFVKSIEYSSKRIELDPNNHVPYIDRGLCYRKLKKYKEAEKDFNKSLEIKPDFFRAFGYRGFLFLELGFYEKALNDAQQSVTINPDYGYGYLVLGQAKVQLRIAGFCDDFWSAKLLGDPDADIGIKRYCE